MNRSNLLLTAASMDVNDCLKSVDRQVGDGRSRAINEDNWRRDRPYPFAPCRRGLHLAPYRALRRSEGLRREREAAVERACLQCVDTPNDAGGLGPRNRPAKCYRSSAIKMCVAYGGMKLDQVHLCRATNLRRYTIAHVLRL